MRLDLFPIRHAVFFLFALSFAVAGTVGYGSQLNAVSVSGPRDCDNNAIIHCGALSTDELKQKYSASDDVKRIYSHFGIRQQHIDRLDNAVAGQVHSDNTVTVNGRVVAEDVITLGRMHTAGSTAVNYHNGTFYKRAPSDSFASGSLPAFVLMQNGRFQYAVIASCGNPVIKRPAHKEQPQPQEKKPEQKPAAQSAASASASATAVASANVTNTVHHHHTVERYEHKAEQPKIQPAHTETAPTAKTETTTPAAARELPKTGGSAFLLAGMSGIIGGAAHFIYSRRRL